MTLNALKRGALAVTAATVVGTAVLPAATSQARSSSAKATATGDTQVSLKAKKRKLRVNGDGSIHTGGHYGAAITRG